MDAARAADMSDPAHNRWFRRRWHEDAPASAAVSLQATIPSEADELERTGIELLHEWRREQAHDREGAA
jgi:hypothetical protein